jgi:2-hydroxychromene-2-carboxylate isomerase|nr:2-hydroxychromene-2-carboxylate isomerase [Kofleriaceae bacterium]
MISFVFDYVSPYAYLASTQIRALAARHAREVEPVPVLFAGMLASTGARGPAEIPAKRDYLVHDVTRLARMLGVRVEAPATHPFNPLAALRATHACAPERRWPVVEAMFRAAWVDRRRLDDAAVVRELAAEHGVVIDPGDAAAKDALRAATDAAIARGAFGVPTMFVDDQMFWGVDSLPLLERYLTGERADLTEIERWRAVEPSATRRHT